MADNKKSPNVVILDKRPDKKPDADTTIINFFGDDLTKVINKAIQEKMGELSRALTKQLTEEVSKTVYANLQGQTEVIADAVQDVKIENHIEHADEKIITKITEVPVFHEKVVTKNVIQEVPVIEKTIIEKPYEVIKLEKVEDAMSLEYAHVNQVLREVVCDAVDKPFFNNIPVYFNGLLNRDFTGKIISKDLVTELKSDYQDERYKVSVHLFGNLTEADFKEAKDCFLINARAVSSSIQVWEDPVVPGKYQVGGDITFEVIDYRKLDLPDIQVTLNQQYSFVESEFKDPEVLKAAIKNMPETILVNEVLERGYEFATGELSKYSSSDLIDELNDRSLEVYIIGDYRHIPTEDLQEELAKRL